MSRKIIIGLIALMGISLLGIIAVQIYWFNNSVLVRNELFDRSVNEAMNKAVRRLETGHDLKVMRQFIGRDTILTVQGYRIPPPPPPPDPLTTNVEVIVKRDSLNHRINIVRATSQLNTSGNHVVVVANALSTHGKNVKNRDIGATLTFTDTLRVKGTTIKGNFKSPALVISDSAVMHEMVAGYEPNVGLKLEQLKKLSEQIAVEFKGLETGRTIDEKQLKGLLKEELADKAIPIDFTMHIRNGTLLMGEKAKSMEQGKWYRVNLFPDDIYRKKLELALFFPERNTFIARTTTSLLGISIIFTLIILLTFTISIYMIIRQKKISEMKSDFINNMTHEFKTPIATISIAADSIANEKVIGEEEKVRFFAGMIRKENLRMNDQVERILRIARLERKEFEFNFHPTDVHELISEAVEVIRLQVEGRNGRIELRLDAANPVATTDPVHFTNLVFNLLDNANKYCTEVPLIRVTTANVAKGIQLTVEDNGIGMTKAVQNRIFDKFYRLPSGNIHNIKGFGLGLSYVKAILDANDGHIRVTSEPGKGSRFFVFLPFNLHRK